jgi:HAD superfamily hydrolase (TIGR01484 family)
VYAQLHAPLPAICANGAVVYDPLGDRVLRADPLSPDLLAEAARRLREVVPNIVFAVEVENGRVLRHDDAWPVAWDGNDPATRPLAQPDELAALPAVKLLARAGRQDPDVFVKLVSSTLGGLCEATHSTNSGLVEISAAGVTKAAGLAWYCEQHHIDAADVMAFGDMPNDLPMLAWAGRAVAVANAHPAVLDIADVIALSNDEDGVAAYLDRVFS